MAGPVLRQGTVLVCPHGGRAVPTSGSARVLVGGLPAVTSDTIYVVQGCARAERPCTTATWVDGARRVLVDGRPVALAAGPAVTDTGEPLALVPDQVRVTAV